MEGIPVNLDSMRSRRSWEKRKAKTNPNPNPNPNPDQVVGEAQGQGDRGRVRSGGRPPQDVRGAAGGEPP